MSTSPRRSPRGRSRSRPPAGRPARRPQPFLTPRGQAPVRHEVERRSAPWLVYLSHLPRWSVAVVAAALFLAGALAPGLAGGAALLLIAVLLALLAFVTWHGVSATGRALRVIVVVGIAAWGVAKVLGA